MEFGVEEAFGPGSVFPNSIALGLNKPFRYCGPTFSHNKEGEIFDWLYLVLFGPSVFSCTV